MRIQLKFWPTLTTAFLLCVLLGLGTWQLQRKEWKDSLIAEIEARRKATAVDVRDINGREVEDWNYRPAFATGTFKADRYFRMPMISLQGEGGYVILAPFELVDGRWLLINRGWVPYEANGAGQQRLGQSYLSPAGKITIKGVLRVPAAANWLTPANQPEKGLWYSYNLPAMAQTADVPQFLPLVLEADATSNPSGYPVGGQTRLNLSNNHLGYALTWYALAIVLAAVYGVSAIKRRS